MNQICELLFLAALFGAAASDWKKRVIPDRYPAALFLLGGIAMMMDIWHRLNLLEALAGMAAASLPLFLTALLVRGSFGGGDIKLMAAAGFCVGVRQGFLGPFLGTAGSGSLGDRPSGGKEAQKERGHTAWPLSRPWPCSRRALFVYLIPAYHRKIVVDSFGKKDLVNVDDSIVEGRRTGVQIQIPHPKEPFVKHFPLFLDVLVEVVCPAEERLVIMKTEIFHVHRMEVVFSQAGEHLCGGSVRFRLGRCIS